MATKAKIISFLLAGYRHPDTDVPLAGGTITVTDAGTSNTAYVWDDRNKTLPTATGRSTVTLDAYGKAEVYGDGIYKFVIKDSGGVTVETIDYLEVLSIGSGGLTVPTKAALSAISPGALADNTSAYMQGRTDSGDGGHGLFLWNGADLSAEVSADTQAGVYVAPDDDVTGAGGAWVRQYSGAVNPQWFGLVAGTSAGNEAALTGALGFGKVHVPAASYTFPTWARFVPSGDLTLTADPGTTFVFSGGTPVPFMGVGGDTHVSGIGFTGFSRVVSVEEEKDVNTFVFRGNQTEGITDTAIHWGVYGTGNSGYTIARVENNVFSGGHDGILLYPKRMHETHVLNNTFKGMRSTSGNLNVVRIGLSDQPGIERLKAWLVGNTVKDIESSAADSQNIFTFMVHECEDWIIDGNIFEDITHTLGTYRTVRAIHPRTGKGIVSNNIIKNIRGTGINTTQTPQAKIVDNIIYTDNGTDFIGIVARQEQGEISRNTIIDPEIGIFGRFIHSSGTFKDIQVHDNVIRRPIRAGIRAALYRRGYSIKGNTVEGVVGGTVTHEQSGSYDSFSDLDAAYHFMGTSGDASQAISVMDNDVYSVVAGGSGFVFESPAGERMLYLSVKNNSAHSTPTMFKIIGGLYGAVFDGNYSTGVMYDISAATLDLTTNARSSGATSQTISVSENDYNPSEMADDWRITASAGSLNIRGFGAGINGRTIRVTNVGSNTFAILHESTGSAAENRVICPGGASISLAGGDSAKLLYDGGAQRWRAWKD